MDNALNRIVAREPVGVSQLFRLYGYDMQPTAVNLQNLVAVYGSRPLPISNATDTSKPKPTLSQILEMVRNGVQTVGSIISIVKGGTGLPAGAGTGTYGGASGRNPDDIPAGSTPRILGMDKTLFIVIAALAVLVIGLLVFKKEK